MNRPALAFAIPGDLTTLTGGYIYERRLLEGLRAIGHDVLHLQLPASFPDPDARDMAEALATLQRLDPARPLILDGLVSGSIETAGLAKIKAPIIAMVHHPLALETGLSAERRQHLFRTEYDNLRLAAHVLVPSPHTRGILVDQYGLDASRITIAQPGVVPTECRPEPAHPPLILAVGILHPRKGHDMLIEALSHLRDHAWQAIIVGNPWDLEHARQLRDLLDRSPIAARVRLAGRVSAGDLQQLYHAASIFALATRYEGYGLVFDEALQHGLPIVSCAVGAVPQTVPAQAGLLVPPEDPLAFAAAIVRLLENPTLHSDMRAQAARAGRKLPSWEQTAEVASQAIMRLVPGAAPSLSRQPPNRG